MLVLVEMEVALGLFVLAPENAVRRSEFGHDQPASGQVADEAAENRVGNTGHRREDRGRGDVNRAKRDTSRNRGLCGERAAVLSGPAPDFRSIYALGIS